MSAGATDCGTLKVGHLRKLGTGLVKSWTPRLCVLRVLEPGTGSHSGSPKPGSGARSVSPSPPLQRSQSSEPADSRHHVLEFFLESESSKLSSSVPLPPRAAWRVIELPLNSAEPDKFPFELKPADDHSGGSSGSVMLCAANEDERTEWVSALRRVLYAYCGGGMFGRALAQQMRIERALGWHSTNVERLEECVPRIVKCCVNYLHDAVTTDGLFRVAGRQRLMRDLRERFDSGVEVDLNDEEIGADPATIASLLKQYLRSLPTSLISGQFWQQVARLGMKITACNLAHAQTIASNANANSNASAGRVGGESNKENEARENAAILADLIAQLSDCFEQMHRADPDSYATCKYLLSFLNLIHSHAEENRMTSANLSAIFWPIILSPDDSDPEFLASFTEFVTCTVKLLIENYRLLFERPTVRPSSTIELNASASPPVTPEHRAKVQLRPAKPPPPPLDLPSSEQQVLEQTGEAVVRLRAHDTGAGRKQRVRLADIDFIDDQQLQQQPRQPREQTKLETSRAAIRTVGDVSDLSELTTAIERIGRPQGGSPSPSPSAASAAAATVAAADSLTGEVTRL